MKNYRITVNGNVYDVAVEETGAGTAPVAPAAAPKAAPKAAPAAAPIFPVHWQSAAELSAPCAGCEYEDARSHRQPPPPGDQADRFQIHR